MNDIKIQKENFENITYIYNLTILFSSVSSNLSSNPISYQNSSKIKATILSTYIRDGSPARNVDIILQLNPPASVFTVYDENHQYIRSYEEGRYKLRTGVDGKAVIYFSSTDNAFENLQVIAKANCSSLSTQHLILFGDYAAAPGAIPPPTLNLNNDDQLHILTDTPYFHIGIPPQKPASTSTGLSCIAITNKIYFTKQSYSSALENGMAIPSAYLVDKIDNEIAYFIQNNASGETIISPKVTFKVKGSPCSHPSLPADSSRTLQSKPFLNNGHTSITTNNYHNLQVFLENKKEEDGRHTYEIGDKVIFTIYINGFFNGSNMKKFDVFALPSVEVNEKNFLSINAAIPSDKISGYGANIHGSPGRYEIDYLVKRNSKLDIFTSCYPKNWLKGNIITI